MKKVVIIILLILGIAILFYFTRRNPTPETGLQRPTDSENFEPDPSNATFIFDEGSVTLSRGKSEGLVSPDSMLVEETTILDKLAYGDLNGDSEADTALLLARSGGGSGTFIYIAAFVSGPVTYKGSNAVFLGDRIIPQSISIASGTVTVKYLDRDPDEAFSAEPTIPVTKQFVLVNGELRER